MMDQLVQEVQQSVEAEYSRAAARFGDTNHSDHESYAIILEEYEEANSECHGVLTSLNLLWEYIKRNGLDDKKIALCDNIQARAVLAACELIQVAAMAKKAILTIQNNQMEGGSS